MIAVAPTPVEVAESVAERRDAQHELRRVLGGPSRWFHGRADTLLGRIADAEDRLTPDVVIRWGPRK